MNRSTAQPRKAWPFLPAMVRVSAIVELAIGPVQLIVLGFKHPNFHGEIIAELERLRESDTVRVIDALAVHKDADGEVEVFAWDAAEEAYPDMGRRRLGTGHARHEEC
jgi:hypothetical protein